MLKTQDFSKTGVKGTNISWANDVEPKVAELAVKNLIHSVSRERRDDNKHRFIYRVYNRVDSGAGVEEFFHTENLAVVWMYLCGLTAGSIQTRIKFEEAARMSEVLDDTEYDPMTNGTDYVKMPSKKFILDVMCMRAWNRDVGRCQKEWAAMLEKVRQYQNEGRLAVHQNAEVEQLLTDIQSAYYLEAEDTIATVLYAAEQMEKNL